MEIPDELIKRAGKQAEKEFLEKQEKEFNLSEKLTKNIVDVGLDVEAQDYYAKEEDIKEFIKRLKEICQGLVDCVKKEHPCFRWNGWEEIDKLAGDKLT